MSRSRRSRSNAARVRNGPRRVFASALALGLIVGTAACGRDGAQSAKPVRVLLIGDSIMDQEGGAAAFVLRQAGISTDKVAYWGSGLFTRDQYDQGHSITTAPAHSNAVHWLSQAGTLVDRDRPALVVVAMNHNHPPPYPRDAQGNEITDLRSPAGTAMIATQTRTLIDILRRRGARVAFVTPPPDGAEHAPTDNPIWAGMLPVLRAEHVDVIDIAPAIAGSDGRRVDDKPGCDGRLARVRRAREVHYTRFGAGLAGTRLAEGIAALLHASLHGDAAPGDHAVALVPTATGKGYWIVQCDGSVYHFGDAAAVEGSSGSKRAPFAGAIRQDDRLILLVPGSHDVGALVARTAHDGTWIADASGTVRALDGAPLMPGASPHLPVVAIAATPSGKGLYLVGADGTVAGRGDAVVDGNAVVPPVPPDVAKVLPPSSPPPITAIAASPTGGYWIMRDNGQVIARGGAPDLGGTAALALFTL